MDFLHPFIFDPGNLAIPVPVSSTPISALWKPFQLQVSFLKLHKYYLRSSLDFKCFHGQGLDGALSSHFGCCGCYAIA